jgi:hypothetical protein
MTISSSFPRKREPSVFRCTPLGPRFRGDDASFAELSLISVMLSRLAVVIGTLNREELATTLRSLPWRIVTQACGLQGVVALPWIPMSSDLTVARLPNNSHLSKPLNQRDSSNPERILLLI